MNKKKKILIVEDHTISRYGLRNLIENETGYTCVAEVNSVEEALQSLKKEKVDLVTLSISLKGGNGMDLIKKINNDYPETKTLVITMHDETIFAERALHAGAYGYINKEQAPQEILHAIKKVMEGNIYVSEQISNRMLKHSFHEPGNLGSKTYQTPLENLTDRELEVYDCIGRGYNTQQIADQLGVSTKTIENHRENIKHKLGINSYTQLIRHAVQWNMTSQSSSDESAKYSK